MSPPIGHQQPHIFTIGHSTKPIDELIDTLNAHNIKTLVDVRSLPGSTKHPQFNKKALEQSLQHAGIEYTHLGEELGGLRRRNKELGDLNAGWFHPSFRGYADYMQTPEFSHGIVHLVNLGLSNQNHGYVAIMCAENHYRQCHRRLIADALVARGCCVTHVNNSKTNPTEAHEMTPFAHVTGTSTGSIIDEAVDHVQVTYPVYQELEEDKARYDSKKKKEKNEGNVQGGGVVKKKKGATTKKAGVKRVKSADEG